MQNILVLNSKHVSKLAIHIVLIPANEKDKNLDSTIRPGNLAPKMGLQESNCKKISDTTEY